MSAIFSHSFLGEILFLGSIVEVYLFFILGSTANSSLFLPRIRTIPAAINASNQANPPAILLVLFGIYSFHVFPLSVDISQTPFGIVASSFASRILHILSRFLVC